MQSLVDVKVPVLELDVPFYCDATAQSDRLQHLDIREHSVASLQRRYDVDMAQAERVSHSALTLFSQVRNALQLNDEDAMLLGWAATLFEVGLHIHSSARGAKTLGLYTAKCQPSGF